MNILLVGSLGKMAKNIKEIACENDTKIIAEIDKNCVLFNQVKSQKNDKNFNSKIFATFEDLPQSLINKIDVVLDFSNPEILKDEIAFCLLNKFPLVLCTTGHNETNWALIKDSSKHIPIFVSANASFGINLISNILAKYVDFLKCYEIDIVESHHKTKIDSPSGTAKEFAKILSQYSPTTHSIRAGEIVGTHDIILTSQYEQITISHKAFDRKLFAKGALDICHFMHNNLPAKLYTMSDIFSHQ